MSSNIHLGPGLDEGLESVRHVFHLDDYLLGVIYVSSVVAIFADSRGFFLKVGSTGLVGRECSMLDSLTEVLCVS